MTLYEKSLKCAIRDLGLTKTRDHANFIYKKWDVFHKNSYFIKAIKEKQIEFEKKKLNHANQTRK